MKEQKLNNAPKNGGKSFVLLLQFVSLYILFNETGGQSPPFLQKGKGRKSFPNLNHIHIL